ncbi:MAG TPA: hypothetical protein VLB80_01185 [Candidatus Babeliales bacterium]|nr:hypothetical protein [Candidatus Babeliales bacterium]
MKKMFIAGIVVICVSLIYTIEQDFIKPKIKKYFSEQQCIELNADIIVVSTDITGLLADISKAIFLITRNSLKKVNAYVDGEKNILDKTERTELYEKNKKLLHQLKCCNDELQKIQILLKPHEVMFQSE